LWTLYATFAYQKSGDRKDLEVWRMIVFFIAHPTLMGSGLDDYNDVRHSCT